MSSSVTDIPLCDDIPLCIHTARKLNKLDKEQQQNNNFWCENRVFPKALKAEKQESIANMKIQSWDKF